MDTPEPPKYDKKELLHLLFQVENLQHSRIYYFLVAETIFILAAVAALACPPVFVILSVGGLLTAFIFTFTNVKLYWRILWLIRQLERVDPLYDDYINFKTFDQFVTLSCFERCLRNFIQSPSHQPEFRSRWHHTGFLYTWGLFWIIVATWIALLIYGILKICGQAA